MVYKTCVSIAEKTPKKLKQTLAKALKNQIMLKSDLIF